MTFQHIKIETRDAVAVVVIDRHERRNALAEQTITELGIAFDQFAADPAVSAVVITGAGDKAFCMGADLEEGFDAAGDVKSIVLAGQAVFQKIERFPKPVVAAVNGYALGGGFELMLACDMSVVADNAPLGQPECGRGVIPGWGGTQKIPRICGKNAALELLLLGHRIRPEKALELGLINRVAPKEKVLEEAVALAARLGRQPAHAVALIKDAVSRGLETSLDNGLAIEADNFAKAYAHISAAAKDVKG
ncbi:MAG: putative enoyl-CoA hydratase echA8 [bacterium ADurb.Bin236]|nr:MAG: putative enoyl-CoA hydratase echA8 [bacterium ADurb.Bin236]HOY61672.1 enoyl-CoA hydratase/isomerase family protein [bacterium]